MRSGTPSTPRAFVEVKGVNLERDRPAAQDLYYHCNRCDGMVPSLPLGNLGCACGDVFVDKDAGRLVLRDPGRTILLRKVGNLGE